MFELNADAGIPISEDRAFRRGRAGLLEGFELAREEMVRTKGHFSIENNFIEEEQKFLNDLAERGHSGYRPLSYFLGRAEFTSAFDMEAERENKRGGLFSYDLDKDLEDYPNAPGTVSSALSALMEEGEVRPEVAAGIRDYNAQFRNLEGTGLQSIAASGVANSLLSRAHATAVRAYTESQTRETTTGGSIGYFAGGMIGYIDPRTNPLATLSLPFGGAGRTVAGRIVSEAVVQAGIEAGIQATGGQETLRRLGLPNGLGPAVGEIAMAGAFGGAFQAVGEGVRAGVRAAAPRLGGSRAGRERAPDAPDVRTTDIEAPDVGRAAAPEPGRFEAPDTDPPYGPRGPATRRAAADLQGMQVTLGRWDGGLPMSSTPAQLRGSTALTSPADTTGVQFRAAQGAVDSPLAVAQLVDPELARRWTKLSTLRDNLRADLQHAAGERVPVAEERIAETGARVAELEGQVAKLKADIADSGKKARRQKLRRVLREKEAQLEEAKALRTETERAFVDADGELTRMAPTPREAAIRQRLIETDEKMRDLAPLFSRAVAANRGDFKLAGAAPKLEDLVRAIDNGDPYEKAIADALEQFNAAEAAVRADPGFPEPARVRTAEEIKAAVDEPDMRLESGVAALRAQVAEEGTEFVQVSGRTLRLDDKITLPVEEGEGTRVLTVRELIDEIDAEDDLVGAFTTCRIG